MPTIQLNGNSMVIPETVGTLAALCQVLDRSQAGLIAERNGGLVRDSEFATTPVSDGDQIELIQFIGGGEAVLIPELIRLAYYEDCPNRDVTTDLTVDPTVLGHATVIAKESGVFFGADVARACRDVVNSSIGITFQVQDGQSVGSGTPLFDLSGPLTDLLKLERVMLNFLQRLSGIATTTAHYVAALDNPLIQVLETRKTTPLLRDLEKQAVAAGGGYRHRQNLSDMVLIKENHLIAMVNAGQLDTLRDRLVAHRLTFPDIRVEIEIESIDQIDQLPLDLADIVMFDNFSVEMIKAGAERLREAGISAAIEVSGNVTIDTIGQYRHLPIQRISVGALTHSVRSLDLSMRMTV